MSTFSNRTTNKQSHTPFLSNPFCLVLTLLFFLSFITYIIASSTEISFLGALRYKFSKTVDTLSLGEKMTNFFSYLSPLLLGTSFLLIFFFAKKLPNLCSCTLMTATLSTIASITLFACLNTYNIIELFNVLSANIKYIGSEMKSYYTNLLVVLVSYQILLPLFAGTFVRFALSVKNNLLSTKNDRRGALPFAVSNLALALWHIVSIPLSSKLMKEYLSRTNVESTIYYINEISTIICALAMSIFAYKFYLVASTDKSET